MLRHDTAALNPPQPRCQSGAAAVEFAMVFPLLFMLMYGVIVYSYMFILQESMTYAVQEAAEAAVAVDSDEIGNDAAADAERVTQVRNTAVQVLSWLPTAQQARVLGDSSGSAVLVTPCPEDDAGCPTDTDAVIVSMTFNLLLPTPLFPVISIGGLDLPPIPASLSVRAVARI